MHHTSAEDALYAEICRCLDALKDTDGEGGLAAFEAFIVDGPPPVSAGFQLKFARSERAITIDQSS